MTLYLTNWSKARDPAFAGSGTRWTAMAHPRRWERGEGRVASLAPLHDSVRGLLASALAERAVGVMDGLEMAAYRAAFLARLDAYDLRPGSMRAYRWDTMRDGEPVKDGDAVCCACSVRDRAAGRCHLAFAVPAMVRAGWDVVMDGKPLKLENA